MSEPKPTPEDPSVRSASGPTLESLLLRYLPELRALLRLECGSTIRARESASDLTQSVCREVLADQTFQYRGEAAFRAWLFTVARHKIRDRVKYYLAQARSPSREEPLPSDADDLLYTTYRRLATPSQQLMAREGVELIERCLDGLSALDREVLVLGDLGGLTQQEIAAALDTTESAIRQRAPRARDRLAAILAREEARPEGRA